MRRIQIAALVLLLGAQPVQAAHKSGAYMAYSFGNHSCVDFLKAREKGQAEHYYYWLAGYLSAYNRWTKDVFSVLNDASLHAALHWIERDCREHPNDPFAGSIEHLVLDPPRLPGS